MNQFVLKAIVESKTLWRKLTGERKRNRFLAKQAFERAVKGLKPGDWAIDLGANKGQFTTMLAASGAHVIAFEPDPSAFAILKGNIAGASNVELIHAAASDRQGTFTLYRHKEFKKNPTKLNNSSSLLRSRHSADRSMAVEVQVVDFAQFLASRNLLRVELLKIDIEGAEVQLLEQLFATGEIRRFRQVFVETHERVLPELDVPTSQLKRRALEYPDIAFHWENHG
jgi:FkbM family methyltransferase